MATTNWWVDIEQSWLYEDEGEVYKNEYSVGPIELSSTSTISVQDFVDIVNEKFEDSSIFDGTNLDTWVRYQITPSAHLPGPADSASARDSNSFIIKYLIDVLYVHPLITMRTLKRSTLKFRDGPHGYAQPDPPLVGPAPRGDVYWLNGPNIPATLLNYASQVVTMTDKPPLPPNINIVPYAGVNNKILLSLNTNIGEYQTTPVLVRADDAPELARQISSQHSIYYSPDEVLNGRDLPPIFYRNDDPTTRYEILRTTLKPTSYTDFDTPQNPHAIAAAQVTSTKRASGVAYVDSIQPNTKYYYCFRAIDVHNNFSNPTHIFEVELVDNAGQVYLISKAIMLETDISADNSKAGRKYVYIEPSIGNLSISEMPASNSQITTNPGDNLLGSGDTCWGKTFKVRLTSKKSNKKIDLNILFKNTGVINP